MTIDPATAETITLLAAATALTALLPPRRTQHHRPRVVHNNPPASHHAAPAPPSDTAGPRPTPTAPTPPPSLDHHPGVPAPRRPPHPRPPAETRIAAVQATAVPAETSLRPLLVSVDNGQVEVLLEHPSTDPPPGWEPDPTHTVLRRPILHPQDQGPGRVLVPLGVDDHPHRTSLNLDVARAISLTGDPTVAVSQLDAIRHALRARAGDQSLQLIDMLSESPDQTAVARDQTWRDVEALLELAAGPSPRQEIARPLTAVVLTAERPPAAVLPRLLDPHSPVAVVALEPLDLGYRLDCTPTRITLHPVGVAIPVATNHALDHQPKRCPHVDPPADTDPLVVELLGPIRAPSAPQLRGKALAVLAFLAHRRTATADQLDAACWDHPHRNTKRRRNVLADLRRAIGPDRLPRGSTHGYALSPAVTTDAALFDHHLTLADAADNPTQKAQLLECALALVKGPVLTYPPRTGDSFRWIDDDNLLAHWELKIERTALTAAATLLDLDQPERAVAVLEQALRALPLNTGLTEQLMAAHAHAGHFDAVERIYQNHRRALRRHLDLDPEPSTDALHAELTQPGTHPASSPPSSSPTSSSSQPV